MNRLKVLLLNLIFFIVPFGCRNESATEIIRKQIDIVDTTNIAPLSDTLTPSAIGNDSNKADNHDQ